MRESCDAKHTCDFSSRLPQMKKRTSYNINHDLNSQTYFRNSSTTASLHLCSELGTLALQFTALSPGATDGAWEPSEGPVNFSRLPHPPQQRPCLSGHQWDNPPTQGANGECQRARCPMRRDPGCSVLVSHALGGLCEGNVGGWTRRVGPSGTSHSLVLNTGPLFSPSLRKNVTA